MNDGLTKEMPVPGTAIVMGALLCVLGLAAYAMGGQTGSAERSPTALIPTGFGALIALMGFFSIVKPDARRHFMHAAAAIGTLGVLGGLGMFFARIGSKGFTLATCSMLTMGILCAIFVALCVRSFIAARRARQTAA